VRRPALRSAPMSETGLAEPTAAGLAVGAASWDLALAFSNFAAKPLPLLLATLVVLPAVPDGASDAGREIFMGEPEA